MFIVNIIVNNYYYNTTCFLTLFNTLFSNINKTLIQTYNLFLRLVKLSNGNIFFYYYSSNINLQIMFHSSSEPILKHSSKIKVLFSSALRY